MRFGYHPREVYGDTVYRTLIWLGPIGLRFGREGWRIFSERYQGTRGIPRRYFYFFGGRLTIIRARRRNRVSVVRSGDN